MKRQNTKSDCPVNVALEAFGDSWSLLIVRDIAFWGKKTYNEFLESEEHIATNVLASRLEQLEQKGILKKKLHPKDARKHLYELSEKGLDLIPIVIEMVSWSSHHDAQAQSYKNFIEKYYANRTGVLEHVRKTIQNGGSIFENSQQ